MVFIAGFDWHFSPFRGSDSELGDLALVQRKALLCMAFGLFFTIPHTVWMLHAPCAGCLCRASRKGFRGRIASPVVIIPALAGKNIPLGPKEDASARLVVCIPCRGGPTLGLWFRRPFHSGRRLVVFSLGLLVHQATELQFV